MSYNPIPNAASSYHLISASGTNEKSVKSGASLVHGWFIYNNASTVRKVAFYNSATAVTAGTTGATLLFALTIPPQAGANAFFPTGISFPLGIAITTVTGIADSNPTGVNPDDLNINIFYT